MAIVDIRTNLWEALAGREPGLPLAPADPDVWRAVVERLNPAKARPSLREGVEASRLTTVRGVDYVMLRSPDLGECCYLRLSPDEHELAQLMDGTRSVAALVADFLSISGRLSPDQVRRVVGELAANRMLDELPVDAFAPLKRIRGGSAARRFGRGLFAFARGRRMVLANIDPLVGIAYRLGGRLLFTRVAMVVMAAVAVTGLGVFGWTWARGAQSVFLVGDSYAVGALALLGLNVVALCSHEMGHALAAKHAGRRVPAAGFLLYFGIPTAFVDTTDVWMAGRRARLRTTAAGPAAALTLAGAAQLVGLVYPTLGAVCFKLSFAWYLNSLFNLNPLMALDGYYLLMDWFEVSNLRARGIAFIVLTFRLRRPKWSTLDREGRFVALYGVLSVLWLLIALNLFYRVYLDRLAGLVTGLWHVGPGSRALLVAVLIGLAAPVVFALVGSVGRRVVRVPKRLGERRRKKDLPHRIDALRASALAALPTDALTELALAGRWLAPRSGTPLIVAGGAPRAVYLVADGTLEARAPGDPTGSVRERATVGDLVGAAPVLTATASTLTWTTVGTRLFALPASRFLAFAGAVVERADLGAEGATSDRVELDKLLSDAPVLDGLSPEDRIAVLTRSHPVDLAAGETHEVELEIGPVLVSAGVVTSSVGHDARRGDVLVAGQSPVVATARSRSRLWQLPADTRLAALLGAATDAHAARVVPHTAPTNGVHPVAGYPPLRPLVGPPPTDDGTVDRGLARNGRRLALLLLLLLLVILGLNTRSPITWAEMPHDRADLKVTRGFAVATLGTGAVRLGADEHRYVGHGDTVVVERDSLVQLTFRGGGRAVLCAGSRLRIGPLYTVDAEPAQPAGELELLQGRAVAATATASGAFAPLTLRFTDAERIVTNDGAAVYTVAPGRLAVAAGTVLVDGRPQTAVGALPDCGSANALPGPDQAGPGPTGPGGADPGGGPTPGGTSGQSPTGVVDTPTSTGPVPNTAVPPPPNTAPIIDWVRPTSLTLSQVKIRGACTGGPSTTQVIARVHDGETSAGSLGVTMHYSLAGDTAVSGTVTMKPTTRNGPEFAAVLGPVPYAASHATGGAITITVRAVDPGNKGATPKTTTVTLATC